jgi:ElaA protein
VSKPALALQWQCLRFDDLGVHALYDVLALRCRVFILEQGAFQDPDGVDQQSWHVLGRDAQGKLHAYLRLVDAGVKYPEPSMGRVVTSPEVRGTGLGRALTHQGIAFARQHAPGAGLRISAQARLQRFYAGFGFEPVGEEYAEDDIPHIEMLLKA